MQFHAILCNFMQVYAVSCNFMQFYASLCNFMQSVVAFSVILHCYMVTMLLLHCCFVTMLHSDTVTLQCCNVAFCIIAVASIFAISIIINHHLLCFLVFSNDHFLCHHLGHSLAHYWHIFMAHF